MRLSLKNLEVYLLRLRGFKPIETDHDRRTHGTIEPAVFVTSLAELFTHYGDSIQVGFEIPADQMTEFLKLKTDSSIYKSDFFSKIPKDSTSCRSCSIIPKDGRASSEWAIAISKLNKNKYVHIFFYDINKEENKINNNKDSLMYLKIKRSIQTHPQWKTLTLGGNVHNMLQPYKGKKTTATYLDKDTELNLKQKFCSLNHNFQKGTMSNMHYYLNQVNLGDSKHSKLTHYDNYLYIYINDQKNIYSGIFFTKTVTATTLAKKK